jgi:hypothetical protein
MGDKKFEGKVTVHQDGSVTTESTAKEVDVEGGGKKRLKLKSRDGKLMVVDEQGEEMALEQGGKFKKRSLIKEGGAKTEKTGATTGVGTTTTTTGAATQGTHAGATTTAGGAETKATTKVTPLKIDIKKMTLEGEEKGVVPVGGPLAVVAEVKASDDSPGPFTVNGELKKGQQKQKFTETIASVKKGVNSFTWNLPGKAEVGSYVVLVEIANTALKVKDKASKSFRVKEQKVVGTKTTITAGQTSTEAGQQTEASQEKNTKKKMVLKIDIKKMTLEGEAKGLVPVGSPLIVVVEVSATDECVKPFAVTGELKKGTQKKQFSERITGLKAGLNSFRWNLPGKAEVGSYVVVVEIANTELKLKDRASKSFRVK